MDELKCATPEGTARYRDRLRTRSVDGHFRWQQGLWMSSIGIGTYLGGHDEAMDRAYSSAIAHAVKLGTNVIDTAINYRFQRSERAVGAALKQLFSSGQSSRDELIIATKGGFIPFEDHPPNSQEDMQAYFEKNFIQPGILFREDIVAGCHSLKPRYLQNQLDRSLQNLGIEAVDIYYLHNPETQLSEVSRQEFYKRLLNAFEMLEKNVAAGKIRMYGTATWNAYRVASTEPDYMSLNDMVQLARTVGGDGHHFKVVQLPFSLAMPEAFGFWNQRSVGERTSTESPDQRVETESSDQHGDFQKIWKKPSEGRVPAAGKQASTLMIAQDLGITVMASASILQAQLAKSLPSQIAEVLDGNLDSDAQRAIQFTRSTPGISVALVGMSQISHVEENLRLAGVPPLPFEKYRRLFKDSGAVG